MKIIQFLISIPEISNFKHEKEEKKTINDRASPCPINGKH
jgi:hypothetical protein